MRKKDKEVSDAQDFTGMPASGAVTPADIQQKEFGVSRFGGYRMRDVDEFLDQVTVSMTKLAEDNQRLRTAGGLPAAPGVGAPDLADTSRQADEIIERARAEANAIVREAREQAAAITAGGGPGPDAVRAAVAPFLSQERDFLQQLATLVQGHAESVKGMAKASRAASAPPAAQAPPPARDPEPPARDPEPPARDPEPPVVTVAEAEPDAPAPGPATQPMPPVSRAPEPSGEAPPPVDAASEPIRVEEPATASVGAGDPDDESAPDGGDRSLRELFWGEE